MKVALPDFLVASQPRSSTKRVLAAAVFAVCGLAASQLCAFQALAAAPLPTEAIAAAVDQSFALGQPYIRMAEISPTRAQLQIASKSFVPKSGTIGGPVVHLVGAIHVADAGFYSTAQQMLDGFDVVLFEGVRPEGGGRLPANATAAQRAETSADRVKVLATLVEQVWHTTGTMPTSVGELIELKPKLKSVLEELAVDGWSKPIVIERAGGPHGAADEKELGRSAVRIVSFGSDGVEGGETQAADIVQIVSQPTRSAKAAGKQKNLQERLAKAFGLSYQGDEMVTTSVAARKSAESPSKPAAQDGAAKPSAASTESATGQWRSSDLSIDEVIARAKAAGSDAGMLLAMLDGDSLMSKLAGMVLGFIESSPALRAQAKVALVQVLATADPAQSGAALGKSGAGLMKVIIEDRNEVVLGDLAEIIKREPKVRTVAAFYGAGHMADLETKLVERFGYQPGEVLWMNAVTLDAKELGLSEREFKRMRQAVPTMPAQKRAPKTKASTPADETAPAK